MSEPDRVDVVTAVILRGERIEMMPANLRARWEIHDLMVKESR
jgi:hypothetical protein